MSARTNSRGTSAPTPKSKIADAAKPAPQVDRGVRYGSSTVDKALDVLAFVAGAMDGVTNLDVSRELGIDKSTSHRLLSTLERKHFVQRPGESHRYTLGPFIGYLAAYKYVRWMTRVSPTLHELVALTGESASFSLRRADTFLCLDAVPSYQEVRYCPKTQTSYPLNAGASGKAILASMPDDEIARILEAAPLRAFTDRTITKTAQMMHEIERIRAQGYATSAGERVVGGCAIAVPVLDPAGEVLGALSISAVEARCPVTRLYDFREDLHEGACRLTQGDQDLVATPLEWDGSSILDEPLGKRGSPQRDHSV